jgi:hypothetical protein
MTILDVPYSSQVVDVDARDYRNDCGPTALEMVLESFWPENQVATDDIMRFCTGGADVYTSFSDLIRAGDHFSDGKLGFDYHANVEWEQLVEWVRGQHLPVIALVHYGDLVLRAPTSSFRGPHFAVVTGWETRVWGRTPIESVFYHDPLHASFHGANLRSTRNAWMAAWRGSTKDGNRSCSCIVPRVEE